MRNYDPVIHKNQLKHGAYYKGRCRNTTIARWDGVIDCFVYWREKFGHTFTETIRCPEDDRAFDVFVAEVELTEIPEKEIPLKDHFVGNA